MATWFLLGTGFLAVMVGAAPAGAADFGGSGAATASRSTNGPAVAVTRTQNALRVTNGVLTLEYDLTTGRYGVTLPGGAVLSGISCQASLANGAVNDSSAYGTHILPAEGVEQVRDAFGEGTHIAIRHISPGRPMLRQHFWIYPGRGYFLTRLEVQSDTTLSTNYMAPIATDGQRMPGSGVRLRDCATPLRTLFVPYDNGNSVRYNSDYASDSYEVTAIYDNASRRGLVAGSITHDAWKTGLEMKEAGPGSVGMFRVYGGKAGDWTHDSQPHGYLTGTTVASPLIFVGGFADWRDGLEAYGRANALITPPLAWAGGPPFGWNSWYAFWNSYNYADYRRNFEILRDRIVPGGFQDDGVIYFNIDGQWPHFSDDQLRDLARAVHAGGHRAGIYFSPFSGWIDDLTSPVEGTNGKYRQSDILLKDRSGNPLPKLDGGRPMDPTHPGTLAMIDYDLHRFVEWGFDYIKLDFLNAGALEGQHYDRTITTGTQAYNYGMRHILADLDPKKIGRPFFISLSIAPLFPSGYAHSRRISCDAEGRLKDSEYVLNCTTYGWWAAGTLYRFNDPDMVPFDSNDRQARTRIDSCIVTGGMILNGNNLTDLAQEAEAREHLTNPEINALARTGRTFRPVEGDTGAHAADTFVRFDSDGRAYVAVFNWDDSHPVTRRLDMARLGFPADAAYEARDLWLGRRLVAQGALTVDLEPEESTIFCLTRKQ